jgi:hypothetical protein
MELIKNGVPTDASSLNLWNYSNVTVDANDTYSNVFNIGKAGFMTQFTYVTGTASTIEVNIPYKLSGTEAVKGQIVIYTKTDNNVSAMLVFEPTDTDFLTLSFSLSINAENVTKAAFEVTNTSDNNLLIAEISVNCNISDTSGSGINTSDYMKSAIIFGTDANKPALR